MKFNYSSSDPDNNVECNFEIDWESLLAVGASAGLFLLCWKTDPKGAKQVLTNGVNTCLKLVDTLNSIH
ncbi:MAG: hypothetical protein LUH02_05115 [Erysipelotrichaceae bacterium]|nr:hypothetical protein [Erysipelotrichaceae bacterium]